MAFVRYTRGGLTESVHQIHAVATNAAGSVLWSSADCNYKTFWRSGAKPFQILPFLTRGGRERFNLTNRELAVMVSSHSGADIHTELVAGILGKMGLTPGALGCGASQPLDEVIARDLYKRGAGYTALHNDCSGKHAGMLGLALLAGLPLEGYIEPEHQVQAMMREAVADAARLQPEEMGLGVDGCGVPTFYLSILNMALSYARLGCPVKGEWRDMYEHVEQVRKAMIENPDCVGGAGRFETVLMEVTQGRLVAKLGAEAGFCIGDASGVGLSYKISDGGGRALPHFGIAVLRHLDLITAAEQVELKKYFPDRLRNDHHQQVGSIEVDL